MKRMDKLLAYTAALLALLGLNLCAVKLLSMLALLLSQRLDASTIAVAALLAPLALTAPIFTAWFIKQAATPIPGSG